MSNAFVARCSVYVRSDSKLGRGIDLFFHTWMSIGAAGADAREGVEPAALPSGADRPPSDCGLLPDNRPSALLLLCTHMSTSHRCDARGNAMRLMPPQLHLFGLSTWPFACAEKCEE